MLTILDAEGNAVPFDVSVSIEIENLKALVEADLGIPTEQQVIHFQGKELVQGQETLESYGVKEGDLLLVIHKKSMNPEHPPASVQQPWPLELLNDNLALQNPSLIDVEIQKKIEEAIRQERVNENLHHAFEYSPESFVRVPMLYINMKVNNHPVKAFVDCGAQNTIISPESAEKCVEGRGESLLFGLDMLKRYQACIDLKKNALVIQEREIPFLPENEIPKESFDSYLGNAADDVESVQASGGDESTTTGSKYLNIF
ncbi:DNA damage-inducible protein 1 [Malassezia equina]|uniref:DNA damage-inducible protein 1 n=1 Tax=Malassezia equina TaxID=1381935 RepID=A0AAF0EGI6_9BASI|nr:DNA damage-inducible protein 1 [Malassezia equina]